jgi:anthrone oxygenase-like protein
MNEWWTILMLISGGLFVGGVAWIALERIPAWRQTDLAQFRAAFAYTLRRVDRVQPALLTVCLVSTIGFALNAGGVARTPALLATAGYLVVLLGSAAWLVPIQRRLVASGPEQPTSELQRLRTQWLRGHTIRVGVALASLILAAVAALS